VTLTLTLKRVRIIARAVDNPPTNFDVSMSFRSRRIGQHVSDASGDLATLTFDLGRSRRLSVMRVFVLRLYTKFEVHRPSRLEDIGIYCVSSSWPGDLDLLISK